MTAPRRFDTHLHTHFSPDGRSSLADYAALVDRGKADALGFTEHYEFWPESDACGFFREDDYLKEVAGWRSRGYEFFAGVEVDWMPAYEAEIRDRLGRHPFAYAIGSVHNLPSASVSGRDTSKFTDDATFDRVITEYRDAVVSSLSVEAFDVVGHPGVFLRHLPPSFFEGKPWTRRIEQMEDDLARAVAASGKILEVNTSGYSCARGAPCAGPFLLERFRAYGGERVSLGSDSHEASHVRRHFDQATALLVSLGFTEVWLPWDREEPAKILRS